MSRLSRVLFTAPRRAWRYALVAALAFVLGSATLAAAATGGVSIGSLYFVSLLNGVATTPCSTVGGPDGTKTTTCVAVINANGELTTSDAATRAALAQLQFGSDGSLKVATQGTSTISGNVNVNNFPSSQQVNGTVNVGNLPATQQVAGSVSVSNLPATQQVAGTVNVGNLPADQQIHGTVTVSNMPAGGAAVTAIALPTQNVADGKYAEWHSVDVSACRSFSVQVWEDSGSPDIYVIVLGPFYSDVEPDLKKKDGYKTQLAFAVQPWSTEPFFYSGALIVGAVNRAGHTSDLVGTVYCQH
jgi:hypothetical protein